MNYHPNVRLVSINWDEEEVPEGYVDLTFRIPDDGHAFSAKTTADITVK